MTLGLPPAEFWDVTLREADVILRAAGEREHRQKRLADGRAYSLAQLISYSVNDPKRMPRFDKVFPDTSRKKQAQSAEEIHALMLDWVETMNAMKGETDG